MLTYRPSTLHPFLDTDVEVPQDSTVRPALLTHLTETHLQGTVLLTFVFRKDLQRFSPYFQSEISQTLAGWQRNFCTDIYVPQRLNPNDL